MRYKVAKMKGPIKALLTRDYPMVKWVVDAQQSLHFKTTTADVRKATASSFTNCPGARCIKRTLPGRAAIVSRAVAFVIDGVTAVRYIIRTNSAARRRLIDNADLRNQGIVGQRFTLSKPNPHHELGSTHLRTKTGTGIKHKPFKPRGAVLTEDPAGTIVSFATGMRAV